MKRFAWLVLLVAAAARAQDAADVLYRVRDSYAGLAGYRDREAIEMEDRGPGGGLVRTELESELAAGRLTLRLGGSLAGRRSIVLTPTSGSGAEAIRSRLDEAFGSGAGAALWVPILLLGGPMALPEPEALAVDGEEDCGATRCFVLVGSQAEPATSFRAWVGRDDHLLRRVETELRRGDAVRVFRVGIEPLPQGREPGEVYAESIDVRLLSVVVRVHDRRGKAIADLRAGDFQLRWGGLDLPVEAAEWVGEEAAPAPGVLIDSPSDLPPPAPGRLILFFVQTSFEPSRLSGQMRMREYARRFVDDLRPEDRAAVVSFDSHLKLRADFTTRREPIREALEASLRPGPEPHLRPGGDPSLLGSFDRQAARRAANPERGLEVAARALVPIPGEKIVVFLGWGLGRYGANGVTMRPEYADARRALAAARATVFALDVTDADYHSLEVGLEQVAADTGGTYAKTNLFPQLAMDRLEEDVAGYYVLYFRRPEEGSGPQRVRVDLRDPKRGEVLVPDALVR